MISRMDRYLARTFIVPWLLCLASVLGLYVVTDLFSRMGDFLDEPTLGGSVVLVVNYYVTFVPLILSQVMPMITLLAAMIALARLERHNELTTLKASGISFQRTLAPIFVVSALLAGVLLADVELVVPRLARQMQELKGRLADRDKQVYKNIYIVDLEQRVYMIDEYQPAANELRTIYVVSKAESDALTQARSGYWDDGDLVLRDVIRSSAPISEMPETAPDVFLPELRLRTSLTPEQLQYNRISLELRSIGVLRDICRLFPHMKPRMLLEIHGRLAFCVANVVLLLVAIPFAFQHESHSALVGIGVCLLVGIGYYFLVMICTYLGSGPEAVLPPQVAGWLPVAAFGGLGVYLFRSMPT